MSMGIDLRDQFDVLIDESMRDEQYNQFVEYILRRIAYLSKARVLYIKDIGGFSRVGIYGASAACILPKASVEVTAHDDVGKAYLQVINSDLMEGS